MPVKTLPVNTEPFPYAVADGLFPRTLIEGVEQEFRRAERNHLPAGWKQYNGPRERKWEGGEDLFGDETKEFFALLADLGPVIETAFRLPHLELELIGGGYHRIEPGGLLGIHTDFTRSPVTDAYRRVNVLTYLNEGWTLGNGGFLELWDENKRRRSIAPDMGRTVAFVTSAKSWHGHPEPVHGRVRRSVAGYFYSEEPPDDHEDETTIWHPTANR